MLGSQRHWKGRRANRRDPKKKKEGKRRNGKKQETREKEKRIVQPLDSRLPQVTIARGGMRVVVVQLERSFPPPPGKQSLFPTVCFFSVRFTCERVIFESRRAIGYSRIIALNRKSRRNIATRTTSEDLFRGSLFDGQHHRRANRRSPNRENFEPGTATSTITRPIPGNRRPARRTRHRIWGKARRSRRSTNYLEIPFIRSSLGTHTYSLHCSH